MQYYAQKLEKVLQVAPILFNLLQLVDLLISILKFKIVLIIQLLAFEFMT